MSSDLKTLRLALWFSAVCGFMGLLLWFGAQVVAVWGNDNAMYVRFESRKYLLLAYYVGIGIGCGAIIGVLIGVLRKK